MPILYEDDYLVCDDAAITIHQYYFPFGSKRIPYSAIEKVSEFEMGLMNGKLRLWGTSSPSYWFHLDLSRPSKQRAIIIDCGDFVKPVITPDNHDVVLSILQEHSRRKQLLAASNPRW